MGVRVPLTFLSALRTLSSSWVVSSSLDTIVCVESYCILLCYLQFRSLEACSFLTGYGGAVNRDNMGGLEELREGMLWLGCII